MEFLLVLIKNARDGARTGRDWSYSLPQRLIVTPGRQERTKGATWLVLVELTKAR